MASACVNMGVSPDNFLNIGWGKISESLKPDLESPAKDAAADFEFRLHDLPVTMLPADELFSDGMLVPLDKSVVVDDLMPLERDKLSVTENPPQSCRKMCASPKAPRCSSRWRDLLGLKSKKLSPSNSSSTTTKSIRHFLKRNPTTSSMSSSSCSSDASLSLPLLQRNSDSSLDCCLTESMSMFSLSTSRLSLSSSSSSGHEHDDLSRLSLDEKPRESSSRPRVRHVRPKMVAPQTRGVSVDSPRMNAAGKIVFQSLERSSSSPSSLNGGPRYKYRGMERSYSANVRITPVLNVPVCSLRGSSKSGSFGFGSLFTSSSSLQSQRKDKDYRRKESS